MINRLRFVVGVHLWSHTYTLGSRYGNKINGQGHLQKYIPQSFHIFGESEAYTYAMLTHACMHGNTSTITLIPRIPNYNNYS